MLQCKIAVSGRASDPGGIVINVDGGHNARAGALTCSSRLPLTGNSNHRAGDCCLYPSGGSCQYRRGQVNNNSAVRRRSADIAH
jgi:hypothetical protein